MKKYLLLLLVLVVIVGVVLIVPEFSQAQTPPPNLPSKPTQNPIDGGLGILAAAGGAYAIKKLRDKKK